MIYNIPEEHRNKIEQFLKDQNIEYSKYENSFEAFVTDELVYLSENVYYDIIGPNTRDELNDFIIDEVFSSEGNFISQRYHELVVDLVEEIEKKTIGYFYFTKTLKLEFKEISDSSYLCVDSYKNIYSGDILEDEDFERYIQIGSLTIYLDEIDFVK